MPRESGKHFGTVYITLASVLLGLALEDLVSLVRAIEQRDAFVWVTSIFVVHIIMNAWIAYTSMATRVNLEPHPWDALNVFALSAAHFVINSFVGTEAPPFLVAVGVYSLTAAVTVHSATLRGRRDPGFNFPPARLRPVVGLNIAAGVVFLLFGWLSAAGVASRSVQLVFVAASIPYATLWLLLFWRGWQQGLRVADVVG
jgi:hypothetical protein